MTFWNYLKSFFCKHDFEPYGSGYDDEVKCKKCHHVQDREPQNWSFFKWIFCKHTWKTWGTSYDDDVKCTNCRYTRARKPGDVIQ